MNNPSPLVPQGSLLEQKNRGRSRVKLAFFCVVGVHVAALMVALLSQGCKRDQPSPPEDAQLPTFDTNLPMLPPELPAAHEVVSNVPPPLPPEPPPPLEQEYVIQKGDTFSTLATKFGVSTKAIQDANPGVDPLRLQIGKKIVIPSPVASERPSIGEPAAVDSGDVIYVVKSGDRLEKIAAKYGTTARAIADANNLKTINRITVGQKLKIPVKAPPPAPLDTPPPAAPPIR